MLSESETSTSDDSSDDPKSWSAACISWIATVVLATWKPGSEGASGDKPAHIFFLSQDLVLSTSSFLLR